MERGGKPFLRRGEEGNGRTKKKAGGGLAAGGTGRDGAMGGAVTSLRLPSDFTNEMGKNCQTVRAGSNGHPVLCSPYYFDHFISEITDGTQQPVTAPPIAPSRPVPPAAKPPPAFFFVLPFPLQKWFPSEYINLNCHCI